jgi:hypothetical protein
LDSEAEERRKLTLLLTHQKQGTEKFDIIAKENKLWKKIFKKL